MKNNTNSERIAKVIARDTKYSRREVEKLILDGRVKIDETIIYTYECVLILCKSSRNPYHYVSSQ